MGLVGRILLYGFNPRPPRGERPRYNLDLQHHKNVSIHAPHAGSDLAILVPGTGFEFQSTPPTRGATCRKDLENAVEHVSIHAPHAGSDCSARFQCDFTFVSIHAPHAGSDAPYGPSPDTFGVSIHAPHAGSDVIMIIVLDMIYVSIHAPHAGSDPCSYNFRW